MGTLARLWHNNRLLVIAFAVSVTLMLFFAVRFTTQSIYWHDPAHRNQALEPWMTVGYVAHSWGVPPEMLAEKLALPKGRPAHEPLDRLAADMGLTYGELSTRVETAVQSLLEDRPER